METTNEIETPEFSGSATYCPEDNKLRLYVGRVPREEYLKLRAEGWTALHKQRLSGGGDFAATWTPERRDTALEYAGIIEDEDMGPAERAADRAERFAGYREKREGEAVNRADAFDAGPSAHGYQSQARADRAARRHDAIAGRACDAWSKAEYWTRRTSGVISHALHVAAPGVRMGRIKELELAIARHEKNGRQDDWTNHYKLRLAYENQMLEAVGGRAAVVEMVVGGFYRGERIHGIVKSPATGRITSVKLWGKFRVWRMGNRVEHEGLYLHNVERDSERGYRAPTDAELVEFNASQKAAQKAKKEAKKDLPPGPQLINPTDADAERLQALLNENMLAGLGHHKGSFEASTVLRITQAVYSANSKGSYSRAGTKDICGGGVIYSSRSGLYGDECKKALAKQGPVLCSVRMGHRSAFYSPDRVIIITDKPQKALPASVWLAHVPAEITPEAPGRFTCSHCDHSGPLASFEASGSVLFSSGVVCPKCEMHQAGQTVTA